MQQLSYVRCMRGTDFQCRMHGMEISEDSPLSTSRWWCHTNRVKGENFQRRSLLSQLPRKSRSRQHQNRGADWRHVGVGSTSSILNFYSSIAEKRTVQTVSQWRRRQNASHITVSEITLLSTVPRECFKFYTNAFRFLYDTQSVCLSVNNRNHIASMRILIDVNCLNERNTFFPIA